MGSKVIPRWYPAVVPLNDSEIYMLGGMGIVDGDYSCLGDVIKLDTASLTVDRLVGNFAGLCQFQVAGNNSACIGDKTIVALAENDMEGEDKVTMIIEFT